MSDSHEPKSEPSPMVPAVHDDFLARYFEAEARRRTNAPAILAKAFTALREALAPGGITHIVVAYDGSGDSGQVEIIDLFRGDTPLAEDDAVYGLTIEVPTYQRHSLDLEEGTISGKLREVLEYLALDIIDIRHGGWENNEGSYGEVRIDLTAANAGIEHDHNQRIETSENFLHIY